MKPVRFNEANINEGREHPLGTPRFCVGGATVFCFQPDEVEIAAIAAGASIWVIEQAGDKTPDGMIKLSTTLTTVSPFILRAKI